MNRFFNEGFGGPRDFDGMDGYEEEEEFGWNTNPVPPLMDGPLFGRNRRDSRRARYDEAYGDYRGGYGPGGGFGPRPMMPPPPPSMMPPPPSMMPPPRPSMWGRGFGPKGPPRKNPADVKAVKYLMRCGVTKDNLKNLPHDLLSLIQPEHCGLCDFSFDSFIMSRMHYISKNHLKNQKKWLSKTSGGQFQNNEMPFKARNLYCELCDIPITSKAHGDAHYAGKPHRGIVDGRKKPKNPLLLQAGMERRLEQLIRREKRCLKPVEEQEKAEDASGDTSKEPKVLSPELYCEICKTTVTCSDQMTMHMNGKRHLAKEKHHILMMMKGGSNVKNGAEEENEEEGEDEDEDEVVAADAEAKPEDDNDVEIIEGDNADDDWGNESWDNQATTQETAAKADA